MNSYQAYRAASDKAQEQEAQARELVDRDLARMSEILRDRVSDAVKEIRGEFGWVPASIEVNMVDASSLSEPDHYVLGSVSADI